MIFKRLLSLVLAVQITSVSVAASAQQMGGGASAPQGTDLVVLKDGQQLRGTLQEVRPGDKAVLQLSGGQLATIRWDGIARIERNGQPMATEGAATPPPVATAQAAGAGGAPPVTGTAAPAQPAFVGPDTMAYDEDKPIPPGYHVQEKSRTGLLITGAILTGIGVIGVGAFEADKSGKSGSSRTADDAYALLWGLCFLGPGVPLLIVGLASKKKVLRRDNSDEGMSKPADPSRRERAMLPVDVGFRVDPKHGGGVLMLGKTF